MLGWVITFAILALLAGLLGFVALAGSSRDDRQGFAVRFPGPLRDVADLWEEAGTGSLICVWVFWQRMAASFASNSGQIPGNRRERTVVTGSNDVDEIYQRMAVIRRELHTNVRESVAGAEAVVDWGRYTWTYPWIALGAAAAVGYLIYTGGHPKVSADTASPADRDKVGEPVAGAGTRSPERSRIGRNLLLAAWDIMFPVAVRAGQNYVLHWLEQQYPTRTVDRTGCFTAGRGAGRLDGSRAALGH